MPIRVPISLADVEIQFQNCCQMIGKLSANNTMVSESLGELVYLTAYCKINCVQRFGISVDVWAWVTIVSVMEDKPSKFLRILNLMQLRENYLSLPNFA